MDTDDIDLKPDLQDRHVSGKLKNKDYVTGIDTNKEEDLSDIDNKPDSLEEKLHENNVDVNEFLQLDLANNTDMVKEEIIDMSEYNEQNAGMYFPHKKKKPSLNEEGKKVYTCEICEKTFRTATLKSVHKESHLVIICYVCGKNFTRKQTLIEHMRQHTGEKPFSCDVCDMSYTTKRSLYIHQKEKHSEKVDKRTFPCSLCEKAFHSSQRLRDHESITHGKVNEKRYICDICEEVFITNQRLRDHRSVHPEFVKDFTCTVCNKNFKRKHTLIIHMRIHTGERPFTCSICGDVFASSSHMHVHKRKIHDIKPKALKDTNTDSRSECVDEKSLACEVCNKSFTELGDLLKHEQTHIFNDSVGTDIDKVHNEKEDSAKEVSGCKSEFTNIKKPTEDGDIKIEI